MNTLRREANYLGGGIFYLCYAFVSHQVNLSFKHDNIFELYTGAIVTIILMNILEFMIYKIAFDRTGRGHYDYSEKKMVHWGIRFALMSLVYIISLTPLCDIMLTPIVKDCTQWSIDIMKWFIANMN